MLFFRHSCYGRLRWIRACALVLDNSELSAGATLCYLCDLVQVI